MTVPDLVRTPAQTVGPFFHCALLQPGCSQLINGASAAAIRLHGRVYDGSGAGISDALVELWQPDPDGAVVHRDGLLDRDSCTFTGWGRCATDAVGRYSFATLRPGAPTGRPPFFALAVFARGVLNRLFTRAYLPEHDLSTDPLFASLDPGRCQTLVGRSESGSPPSYRFDIHLQGPHETVFLGYRDGRQ